MAKDTRYHRGQDEFVEGPAIKYSEARKLGNRKAFADIVMQDLQRLYNPTDGKVARSLSNAELGEKTRTMKETDHPVLLPQGNRVRKKVRGY